MGLGIQTFKSLTLSHIRNQSKEVGRNVPASFRILRHYHKWHSCIVATTFLVMYTQEGKWCWRCCLQHSPCGLCFSAKASPSGILVHILHNIVTNLCKYCLLEVLEIKIHNQEMNLLLQSKLVLGRKFGLGMNVDVLAAFWCISRTAQCVWWHKTDFKECPERTLCVQQNVQIGRKKNSLRSWKNIA